MKRKIISSLVCLSLIVGTSVNVLADYSISKAGAYARKYALNYNPSYFNYDSIGQGDCANFASQCLKAGGLTTNSTWKGSSTKSKNTKAWINCEAQKSYLVKSVGARQIATYKKASNAPKVTTNVSEGKLVYYDWTDNGSIDHVAIGSMRDTYGRQYVCAHTSDRLNAIWTLAPYMTDTQYKNVRYYVYTVN